ncbi:hypothetical protein ACPCVO_46405 [Streptomyces umbrinus]|uniref:hypothetical protein n=1 Tax=Streptomyces umbrinus TaxID=67370 RepID=UPI003C2B6C99
MSKWRMTALFDWRSITGETQAIRHWARRCATEAVPERDTAVQSLKATGAALSAWAVAGWSWSAPIALLAPGTETARPPWA